MYVIHTARGPLQWSLDPETEHAMGHDAPVSFAFHNLEDADDALSIIPNLFDMDDAVAAELHIVKYGPQQQVPSGPTPGAQPPMESKTRRSPSIKQKLDGLFKTDPVTEEFGTLLDGSLSAERFDNQGQLAEYMCEGALLNIGRIASQALSIPSGEYMIWVTDVGHTMLVPTKEEKAYSEVFEGLQDQYEVLTPDLLRHWSKVERVLAEDQDPGMGSSESSESEGEDGEKTAASPIQSRVDPGDIDRPPMLRAMEDRGFTVSSLAQAAGVQPPAISRLLRTPKERQGDPGGRNPSMGLAAKISKLLRMDPTALFPDIFGASGQDLEARQTPGNRGSGMTGAAAGSVRKGKATEKWTQGAG